QTLYRHTLSQRLRHRSLAALLGIAADLAAPLERIPAASRCPRAPGMEEFLERYREKRHRERFSVRPGARVASNSALYLVAGADHAVFQFFHAPGILRASGPACLGAADWRLAGPRIADQRPAKKRVDFSVDFFGHWLRRLCGRRSARNHGQPASAGL